MTAASLDIRPALADDLPTVFRVALLTDGQDPAEILAGLPSDTTLSSHRHGQANGEMLLAVEDDEIVGFVTVIQRGWTRFLAQLFVLPERQSAGIGRHLMDAAFAEHNGPRGCVSSDDKRAIALYVRYGMIPRWPLLALSGPAERVAESAEPEYQVVETTPDERLFNMDARISARYRPEEHRFWLDVHAGTPLWIVRDGIEIGYAYLLEFTKGADRRWWDPGSLGVEPLGVIHPDHAWPALASVARFAASRGTTLHIELPGPHPALPELIARGFKIAETPQIVMLSEPQHFGDPERYLPSGGTWY